MADFLAIINPVTVTLNEENEDLETYNNMSYTNITTQSNDNEILVILRNFHLNLYC